MTVLFTRISRWPLWLLGTILVFLSSSAFADDLLLRPLQVSNQAPLAALCGLPTPGRARLLVDGESEVAFSWDLSNNFTAGRNGQEQVRFDGETHRLAVRLDRGFADRWEVGIEVPLIAHRGGFLDSFIEGWHDAFGLPQNGRKETARDQLEYRYQNGGSTFERHQEATGLGDIRLFLSHQLKTNLSSALAVHASLELPTGDESEWLGSDSLDASLQLSGDHLWRLERQRIGLFWSGGVLLSDGEGVLSAQRRQVAGTASLGAAWSMWQSVALQLQLDGHTALFDDSELRQIGAAALQLAIGGAIAVSNVTRLELAVVEDIAVNTGPDVTFHLRLSRRF